MKKVVVIDDEPLARTIVREFLGHHRDFELVAECDNGFEGVKAIIRHKPDLVFLDVQMPRISGFEMLELLDEVPPVIFATAFDEYAVKAFERNAVDYLLKPFSKARFDEALTRFQKRGPQAQEVSALLQQHNPGDPGRIVVRNSGEISIVPLSEVQYLEAYDDYVKIFTKDSYFLKKRTLNFYEESLDPARFCRVHRSYMINLDFLTRLEPMERNSYVAVLTSGKKVPVSRSQYPLLKQRLGI